MPKPVVGSTDKKKGGKRAAEDDILPVSKKANTTAKVVEEVKKTGKKTAKVVEDVVVDEDALDFDKMTEEELYDMMMMMEGDEGEFEGEEDGMDFEGEEGDGMDLDADDDEDEENMDLEEMLDLEAKPMKEAKKKDTKKKETKKQAHDEEDSEDDDEEIEASFDFCDPDADKDYHAVKNFIRNIVEDKDFDASSVADIIAGQAGVGTVIRSSGDDSLGFVTCLDYNVHKNVAGIKQLKKFLLGNAGSDQVKKQLEKYFTKGLGLIMHDRVVNMPMEVVPALFNELTKDIEYAQQVVKGEWKFDNYLLLIKCCEVSGKIAAKDKRDLFYTKFEEEFFHQKAVFTKKFASKTSIPWSGVGKLPASIIACVIPAKALAEVRDILIKIIGLNGEESFF